LFYNPNTQIYYTSYAGNANTGVNIFGVSYATQNDYSIMNNWNNWNRWNYVNRYNEGNERDVVSALPPPPTHLADNTRYVTRLYSNVPIVRDNRNIFKKIDDFYNYKIVRPYKPDKWEGKMPVPLQGAVLLFPPVGLVNDGTILFTGQDLQGNPASTFSRVMSFGGICTLGMSNWLYSFGFNTYSAGTTIYKGYENETKY